MLDTNLKNQILQSIKESEFDVLAGLLHALNPTEIASLLESIKWLDRKNILERISDHVISKFIPELSESVCESVFEYLNEQQISNIIGYLEADDIANLLNILSDQMRYRILDSMNASSRRLVEELLSFEEDACGRMMNNDFITVHPDASVITSIRYLKFRSPLPHNTDTIFVVNEKQIFLGTVRVADLITADDDYSIRTLLHIEKMSVAPDLSQINLIDLFVKKNLLSVAVVNEKQHLIGRITVDNVLDTCQEQMQQSLLIQGVNTDQDVFGSVLKNSKKRMLWLGINLLTALLAAFVIKYFEDIIKEQVSLVVLLPIIASMGGIAGSQSLIVTVRSISSNNINSSNIMSFLKSEILITIINGVFWGIVVGIICYLWFDNYLLAMIAGFSITTNMLFGGLSGVIIPWFMRFFNIDPAIAGSVVLTTATDIIGFFLILGMGTWLFL